MNNENVKYLTADQVAEIVENLRKTRDRNKSDNCLLRDVTVVLYPSYRKDVL